MTLRVGLAAALVSVAFPRGDALGEFMRPGVSYEPFRIDRAEEPGEVDYDAGGVPF